MNTKSGSSEIIIRTSLMPGDIGSLIWLHGTLYSAEYGLDHTFEGYVASAAGEFAKTYDSAKDYLGVAEELERMVGVIAIVAVNDSVAQLRWFLVHPDVRGQGVGRKLIAGALEHCRARRFDSVFLWTISELGTAAHLYKSFGFKRSEEKTHEIWGAMRTEERYDLSLKD